MSSFNFVLMIIGNTIKISSIVIKASWILHCSNHILSVYLE